MGQSPHVVKLEGHLASSEGTPVQAQALGGWVFHFEPSMLFFIQLIVEAAAADPTCVLQTVSLTLPDNSISNTTSAALELPENHSTMEKVKHSLHYLSIAILSVFMLEILIKIFASGKCIDKTLIRKSVSVG